MTLGTKVLIALGAGVGVGAAIGAARPAASGAIASVAEPVGTLWINAILMTIVPLVVSKVIVGVAGSASVPVLQRAGGRAVALVLALLVIPAILSAIVLPPIFAHLPADAAARVALRASTGAPDTAATATPAQWLVSLIPTNPVRAAADGAMLPLLIFSAIFGLAVSRIPSGARDLIVSFFGAIDAAITVVLNWVILLAPIGIFALALGMTLLTGGSIIGALGYYILVASLVLVGFTLLLYLVVPVATPFTLRRFARACAPAQVVAFSAHSSVASLPAMLEAAETELALPPPVTTVVLPLAVAAFKYASPIWFVTVVCFLGQLYGIPVEPARLVPTLAVAVLTSFTVAGVPSGSVYMVLPVLLASGLPSHVVGLLLAVDPIPNAFRSAANVTADMAVAALVGSRANRKALS